MAASDVKVLGAWASPFVLRVKIALHLKSVNYEYIEENLMEKSELLLKSNPVYKKVPVLIHGDKPISESLIIVQYIDEFWTTSGPSILPTDVYERATSRFWVAYVDEKFFPTLTGALMAEAEDAKKTAIANLEEGLVLLEETFKKLSKGKAFFGGDNIGYVDIAIGSFVVWVEVLERSYEKKILTEDKTPSLFQWARTFSSHVKDVLPDADKLTEFAKMMRAKFSKSG